MVHIPLLTGFYTSQVVQDFFYQQYLLSFGVIGCLLGYPSPFSIGLPCRMIPWGLAWLHCSLVKKKVELRIGKTGNLENLLSKFKRKAVPHAVPKGRSQWIFRQTLKNTIAPWYLLWKLMDTSTSQKPARINHLKQNPSFPKVYCNFPLLPPNVNKALTTWRIISFSKWLVIMVIVTPNCGNVRLPNGLAMAYKRGSSNYSLPGMILQQGSLYYQPKLGNPYSELVIQTHKGNSSIDDPNYHTFAWFHPIQMGSLITPVSTKHGVTPWPVPPRWRGGCWADGAGAFRLGVLHSKLTPILTYGIDWKTTPPKLNMRYVGYDGGINGLVHLLINGVCWGYYIPRILTFDPNFQQDIQVGITTSLILV